MEEDGDKGHICWRGIHEEAGEDGEIRAADGSAV